MSIRFLLARLGLLGWLPGREGRRRRRRLDGLRRGDGLLLDADLR